MPDWDFNNPESMKAWDLVSGEVRAVVGKVFYYLIDVVSK